jgi:hypothetical protein
MNAMLANVQDSLLDYAKSMPEAGKAEDLDFEVWGKGFCEKMVCCHIFVHVGLTVAILGGIRGSCRCPG